MRLAARQCSTTVCGSAPKDWMIGLRFSPSMRASMARVNASPRFGSRSEKRPAFTSAASLAWRMSSGLTPSR
jgi:hypothetical protein